MNFHGFGFTSEEEWPVLAFDGDTVVIGFNTIEEDSWKFDIHTGKCLNDNTDLGCSRTLKI